MLGCLCIDENKIEFKLIKKITRRIREFNRSAWMGTQRPMPDSQTWVKLLHAEGWTFIPITSQTSDIPAQELRKKSQFESMFYFLRTKYWA